MRKRLVALMCALLAAALLCGSFAFAEEGSDADNDKQPLEGGALALDILRDGIGLRDGVVAGDIDTVMVPAVTILRVPTLNGHCIAFLGDTDAVVDVDAVAFDHSLHQRVGRVLDDWHILRYRASRQQPTQQSEGDAHQECLHDLFDYLAALLFPTFVVVLSLAPVIIGISECCCHTLSFKIHNTCQTSPEVYYF